MNFKLKHEEYKKLRAKERLAGNSEKGKAYSFILGLDTLRVKELAEELMSTKYQDYVKSLPASDRFDIRKVASD